MSYVRPAAGTAEDREAARLPLRPSARLEEAREIAAAQDCKPHDLYIEGIRLVRASYGYDFDKLERGEG